MVASNVFGRQVVIPLTNKSGGSVAAGDVVIIDSANNDAFTTTTSAGVTTPIGVAQATIANNAVGPVLVEGYAALVNVNASVTRLHYGATHTVAKQATDAGASRVAGTFCCFLSSGTTPDALIYPVDLAGAALSNPMTTVGDLIRGGASGSPTRLAASATAGQFLMNGGSATAPLWASREADYAEFTSPVSVTSTNSAAPDTIVTGNAFTPDGSTLYIVEFFCPRARVTAGNHDLNLDLFDGSTNLGFFGLLEGPDAANELRVPILMRRRLTPSNASHTYSVRGYTDTGTCHLDAGAGGAGALVPGYIRVERAL